MTTTTSPHRDRRGAPFPTSARDRAAARLREQLRARLAAEGLAELLSVDEVASIAGIHRSTVWSWMASGLTRIRAGRCTRIPVEELIDWLARRVEVAG